MVKIKGPPLIRGGFFNSINGQFAVWLQPHPLSCSLMCKLMAGITIKQHDITDCGAACLAYVASHYKIQMPIARIRQYAGTDKKGTNVLGLLEAAQKLGFGAKGVRGDFDSLFKIPKPTIAHVVVKDVLHHYILIY